MQQGVGLTAGLAGLSAVDTWNLARTAGRVATSALRQGSRSACDTVRGAQDIVFTRARSTFQAIKRQFDALDRQIHDELVGVVNDWTKGTRLTDKDVDASVVSGYMYGTGLATLPYRIESADVEPHSGEYLEALRDDIRAAQRDSEVAELAVRNAYRNVMYAVSSLWSLSLVRVVLWNGVWVSRLREVDYNLGQARNRASDRLAAKYGYGTAKWSRGLATVDPGQLAQRRAMFYAAAQHYRGEKDDLVVKRALHSAALVRWLELAQALSTSPEDVHAQMAAELDSTIQYQFETTGDFGTMTAFIVNPGSQDRLITGFGAYEFCTSRPFPDIQIERFAPDYSVFKMESILDAPITRPPSSGSRDTDTECRALAANPGQQP